MDATAYAHRSAQYVLNIIARSPDPAGFDRHIEWARDTRAALAPFTTGGEYVNFTADAPQDRVKASYPPATYQRLVAVKDRYDPSNLFRLNQNIHPSGH